MSGLVLSLFPGLDLLGLGFELEGFCIVRGPDLLWGGDVRTFTPPPGRFDGVIGGPPCQVHSKLAGFGAHIGQRHGDLIPEYQRIVSAAAPRWFVMENVQQAPAAAVPGYAVESVKLDNRALGEAASRTRRFSFGSLDAARISPHVAGELLGVSEHPEWEPAVLAGHNGVIVNRGKPGRYRKWQERAQLQGLPAEWIARMEAEAPFTAGGLAHAIGNGVPVPMGRLIARAVKAAVTAPELVAL